MAETEEQRIERIAREARLRREDPLYRSRYQARESERAAGTGVSIPGGLLRMPTAKEAGGFAGETLPPLIGQALLSKAVGPLAGRLAPQIGAGLRAGAGVLGGAGGGAAQSQLAGTSVPRGAAIGAAGAALGEAGAFPLGASRRSLIERAAIPVGSAVRGVARRLPGVSKLFERAPGAEEAIRMLAEEGDGRLPTLGQVSSSNSVLWTEALAQRGVGSHGALATVQEGTEANSKKIAERFVSRYMDVDRVQAGQLIDDVLKDRLGNFRDASAAMYKPVDDALGTSAVPTSNLKAAAEKLMATRIGIRGEGAQRLLNAVSELPETISFAKASAIRSDLLRINRASDDLIKGQAGAVATDLHQIIDTEMESVAKSLNPKLASAWREAQGFYKRGAQDFNDDIIAALSRKEPEEMADYLFSIPKGEVRRSAIERLRRVAGSYGEGQFGESDILEPLRGVFIKRLFREAADAERTYGGNAVSFTDGRKLRQSLAHFEKPELDAMLGSAGAQKLGDIARTIEITQKRAKNVIGTSGLPSVVLLQGVGSLGVWNSDHSGPAKAAELGTIWVLGPRAISWMLRDPKIVKMLASEVPTGTPGSGVAAKFASQFTARMLAAQRMFGADEVKPQRGTLKDQPLSLNDPSRRATTFEERTQ